MTSHYPKARRRFRITRSLALFAVGLGGIIYETVVHRGENLPLLFFFYGMCGLPVFLHVDERKKTDDTKTPPSESSPGKAVE
jgi:hypothetical protein